MTIRAVNTSRTRTDTELAVTPKGGTIFLTAYDSTGKFSYFQDWTHTKDYDATYTPTARTTHDVVTPDYERKKSAGQIINNDFSSTKRVHSVTQGEFYYATHGGNPSIVRHSCKGENLTVRDVLQVQSNWTQLVDMNKENLMNQSITRAYANLSEMDMASLVSLAELHKTVALARDLFNRVAILMYRGVAIKYRLRRAGITAARAAQLWMEVRFGLRPLYYECQDLIETFQNLHNDRPRSRITAVASDSYKDTTTYTKSCLLGAFDVEVDIEQLVTASTGLLVEAQFQEVSKLKKFGFEDVTATLWELVPFSFIVDYFLNTGAWFQSLNPRFDVKVLASWTKIQEYDLTKCRISAMTGNSLGQQFVGTPQVSGMTDRVENFNTTRLANPSKPFYPSLNVRLDWAKITDILALLRNVNFSEWRI